MSATTTAAIAASIAQVTVGTIRTWCRTGVITATKAGGHWIVDLPSLTARIVIGQHKAALTGRARYRVERQGEAFVVVDTRPAGTEPRMELHGRHSTRRAAEAVAAFCACTPPAYALVFSASRLSDFPRVSVQGGFFGEIEHLQQGWFSTLDTPELWLKPAVWAVHEHAAGWADRRAASAARLAARKAEWARQAAEEARNPQEPEDPTYTPIFYDF
ncbi:hypothetical protein [Streptomyces sp. NPDC047315]|uniref:hypothetical protein n=1 Tax=Streptomyces sp. NPDC047315 TaxID=3155142 RepID=UPI0033D9FEEA